MAPHPRRAVVAVVCVSLLSTGCVGFLMGSGPLEFRANETVVGDDALSEADYRPAGNDTLNRTLNATVSGQTRQVLITSHRYAYNRSVDADDLAAVSDNATGGPGENASGGEQTGEATASVRFSVLSTPGARVAGRSLNPLSSLSNRDIVERFTADSTDIEFQGNRTVEALGADRTVSTYRTNTSSGSGAALLVHVATIEHDGDIVVIWAVHPESVDEQARVDTLIAGLERPDG